MADEPTADFVAGIVDAYDLSSEKLERLAKSNPPPQSWYDEDIESWAEKLAQDFSKFTD